MIEGKRLFPIKYRMAALAVLAQPPQMRIFFGMAGRAGGGRTAKLVAVSVTSHACRLGVAPHQRIIGQVVIEANLLESNERELTAMMFAMASFARLRLCRRLAMKPLRLLNVRCDTLMTCKAFAVLRFLRE